jgi:hypothetical protein
MRFSFLSTLDHVRIKSRGPTKKTSHLRPVYLMGTKSDDFFFYFIFGLVVCMIGLDMVEMKMKPNCMLFEYIVLFKSLVSS